MAEILPNGKIQEYTGICPECKKETSVNMQGTPINHECKVKNLDIPHVSKAKRTFCECDVPYFPTGDIKWCSKCNNPTVY